MRLQLQSDRLTAYLLLHIAGGATNTGTQIQNDAFGVELQGRDRLVTGRRTQIVILVEAN